MARPVVVLLTDFGTMDSFVGVLKGVVLTRCPDATIVDLSHEVPPQAVSVGAFLLERCFRWFPEGSVFIAVVDPGVGTERRAIVVAAHRRLFVGPDNGLLAATASLDPEARAFAIEAARLGLVVPSHTFHGRDVFAPVAAELAAGRIAPEDVGGRALELTPDERPVSVRRADRVEGVVIAVDRFGNLVTNIDGAAALSLPDAVVEIGTLAVPLRKTYADVSPDAYVALIGAFDVVEIACRNGDAARTLGIERGAAVVVRRGASSSGG
jgi:S-adenosylmethionine hydrolase